MLREYQRLAERGLGMEGFPKRMDVTISGMCFPIVNIILSLEN